MRDITLFARNALGQVTQTAFCFEFSALKFAREAALSEYVIAIRGRVLHWEGVSNVNEFMR